MDSDTILAIGLPTFMVCWYCVCYFAAYKWFEQMVLREAFVRGHAFAVVC